MLVFYLLLLPEISMLRELASVCMYVRMCLHVCVCSCVCSCFHVCLCVFVHAHVLCGFACPLVCALALKLVSLLKVHFTVVLLNVSLFLTLLFLQFKLCCTKKTVPLLKPPWILICLDTLLWVTYFAYILFISLLLLKKVALLTHKPSPDIISITSSSQISQAEELSFLL